MILAFSTGSVRALLLIPLAAVTLSFSGCGSRGSGPAGRVKPARTPRPWETAREVVPAPTRRPLSDAEVLAARRLYSVRVVSWQAIPSADPAQSAVNLDLEVTNGSAVTLEFLTIRVEEFNLSGELVGWTRAPVLVSGIPPSTMRRATATCPGGSHLGSSGTSRVEASVEASPAPGEYRGFAELRGDPGSRTVSEAVTIERPESADRLCAADPEERTLEELCRDWRLYHRRVLDAESTGDGRLLAEASSALERINLLLETMSEDDVMATMTWLTALESEDGS